MIDPEALCCEPDTGTEDSVGSGPGCGERLLIYGLRRMAPWGDDGAVTRREFAAALGPLGEEALAAFGCFVWSLRTFGRRRLTVGFPGAATISHDEALVVSVIAAAQAGADERLCAHLRWLAGGAEQRYLATTATVIAELLAAAGHALAPPAPVPRPAAGRPQLALISFCSERSPAGRGSSGLICGQAVQDTSPT